MRVNSVSHANEDDKITLLKQNNMQRNVPLLLKPNGVPVFQNIATDGAQFGETIPSTNYAGTKSEWMKTGDHNKTVKAHSFVVGKKITNVTEIAKTTCPEEQAVPCRIVYIKPGINKPNPLVRKDNSNDLTLKKPSVGLNHQLERDISLGDISGIFKQNPKRVKSA